MKTTVLQLTDDTYATLVSLAAGDKPPKELRLFGAGETDTTKGKFTVDTNRVMARFRELGKDKLPFDYGHAMVSFGGGDQRAAAWFTPQARGGELWAVDIEWTPRALRELSEREWRFYSPAFRAMWPDKADEPALITELINCALTNLPATKNQKPIVASEREPMLTETDTTLAERVTTLEAQLTETRAINRNMRIAQLSTEGRLPPAMHGYARGLSETDFERYVAALPSDALPGAAPVTPGRATVASLSAEAVAVAKLFDQDPQEFAAMQAELLSGESSWKFTPKQPKAVKL